MDTKPLIKLFAREDGWHEVQMIVAEIEREHVQGAISVLSLTEIYYKYLREGKPDLADERVRSLRYANYLEKIPIDEQIATKAGEFKGKYSGERKSQLVFSAFELVVPGIGIGSS